MKYITISLSLIFSLTSMDIYAINMVVAMKQVQQLQSSIGHLNRARIFRSLQRKMSAILKVSELPGSRTSSNREVVDEIVDGLLDDSSYSEMGGEVFFKPASDMYHLIKDRPRGKDPFSGLEEHLVQQQRDGLVFALHKDGFYFGTYRADEQAVRYEKFPMQLTDEYSYVSNNAYYLDLRNDMSVLIKATSIDDSNRIGNGFIDRSVMRLLGGRKDLDLFQLLKIRDSVAHDDELLDIFKDLYFVSLKRSGLEDIPSLKEIDERIAALGLDKASGGNQYLTFRHPYGWSRMDFLRYLGVEREKLGADSIARLRIMSNDNSKLQSVLDKILWDNHRIRRANFEQALAEASNIFHMLDIDTKIPSMGSNNNRINLFLTEVAKRKNNEVLHQYFDTIVLGWERNYQSGKAYLHRIHLIEDLVLAKSKTSRQQTVRELLKELGISVDTYLDYTSNTRHHDFSSFSEVVAARLTERKKYSDSLLVSLHENAPALRVEFFDMLSNIATSIQNNFTPRVANKLTKRFLELHPDVAIIKEVKTTTRTKVEVVGVEVVGKD